MGTITLTDRISVSVRAKNETQANSQKRDTGKNIANALGNGDISDSLADELGATTKPTITDENGNEWISMADIIAAGKKMYENGAFNPYNYISEDINNYGLTNVKLVETKPSNSKWSNSPLVDIEINDKIYGCLCLNHSSVASSIFFVSKQPFRYKLYSSSTSILSSQEYSYTINNESVTIYTVIASNCSYRDPNVLENAWNIPASMYSSHNPVDYKYILAMVLFGDSIPKSGGNPIVDWTKPDDEIEEDIRRLHETWDVTEHEGAVTANGTYVLAGPIEYNDADPVG